MNAARPDESVAVTAADVARARQRLAEAKEAEGRAYDAWRDAVAAARAAADLVNACVALAVSGGNAESSS